MKKYIYITLVSLLAFVYKAGGQSLHGRISVNDTLPLEYATVYIPSNGSVAVADKNGEYRIDNISKGLVELEFSHIGYKTVKKKVNVKQERNYRLDVPMEEEIVELDAVFVTPDDDDMASFILRKVWEKALANRKALKGYEADIVQNFVAKDADIIPKLMPSSIMFMIRSYVKLNNRGAIMNYVLDNRSVEVAVSTHISNTGWKHNSYSGQTVLASNPTLNTKARNQLFKMLKMDLFNEVYDNDEAYGEKGRKHYRFNLLGNIDYNGKTVYILEARPKDEDNAFYSTKKVYVVDGDWGILRVESQSRMSSRTMECRDIGGGIYMPVSLVEQPAKISFNTLYEKARQAVDSLEEKPGRMVRNVMKKAARLNESGRQITPYVTHEFRITYSNVKL